MVRITLMDGNVKEVQREELRGIFPWREPLRNPHLRTDGVIYHQGFLYPVQGPLALEGEENGPITERAWYLLCDGYAQVIRGLPAFDDDISLNLVPVRERPAPVAAPAPALSLVPAEAAPVAAAASISEAEEEAQLLKELEDLLKTG